MGLADVLLDPRSAPALDYLRLLVAYRRLVRDFIVHGRMLRPPALFGQHRRRHGGEQWTSVAGLGSPAALAALLHAAVQTQIVEAGVYVAVWGDVHQAGGPVVVLLTNADVVTTSASVQLDTRQYPLQGSRFQLTLLSPSGPHDLGTQTGPIIEIPVLLGARDATAIVVTTLASCC
jgi:hypothetical protein